MSLEPAISICLALTSCILRCHKRGALSGCSSTTAQPRLIHLRHVVGCTRCDSKHNSLKQVRWWKIRDIWMVVLSTAGAVCQCKIQTYSRSTDFSIPSSPVNILDGLSVCYLTGGTDVNLFSAYCLGALKSQWRGYVTSRIILL